MAGQSRTKIALSAHHSGLTQQIEVLLSPALFFGVGGNAKSRLVIVSHDICKCKLAHITRGQDISYSAVV